MFQLRKLALQLVVSKKTDHLYVGRHNVFKNTKQDKQVQLLLTAIGKEMYYSYKNCSRLKSVEFSPIVKSELMPR